MLAISAFFWGGSSIFRQLAMGRFCDTLSGWNLALPLGTGLWLGWFPDTHHAPMDLINSSSIIAHNGVDRYGTVYPAITTLPWAQYQDGIWMPLTKPLHLVVWGPSWKWLEVIPNSVQPFEALRCVVSRAIRPSGRTRTQGTREKDLIYLILGMG